MTIENTMLCQGGETEESIDSLISFTKLSSESMRKAFVYHYVRGMEVEMSCNISGVSPSNFVRDSKVIIAIAWKIAKHNEIKYTERESE